MRCYTKEAESDEAADDWDAVDDLNDLVSIPNKKAEEEKKAAEAAAAEAAKEAAAAAAAAAAAEVARQGGCRYQAHDRL